MTISPDEQLRLVDLHIDAALDVLEVLLRRQRARIRARTMERVELEGFAEYGDRTWHRSLSTLVSEAVDELADGGFYLVPALARIAGDLVETSSTPSV